MKVVEISAPEYQIDSKPNYMAVGAKVDALIGSSFEDGKYVVRSIGSSEYPSLFGDIVYHFYEHTLHDRGYRVRIDLLLIYHADELEPATLVDSTARRVRADLEGYLYRFRDPSRKTEALAGLVKILAA